MYEGVNTGGNNTIHYVYASSAVLKSFASRIKAFTTYTVIIYNAPEKVCRVFFCGYTSNQEKKPKVFKVDIGEDKHVAEPFKF